MTETEIISGMAVHVHHDILFEYCHNYQERVDYINKKKPEHERKTRIKLFAMLTQEQIAMLPKEFVEARQKCNEASQKWNEERQKYDEVSQKYNEAMQKYDEARQKYDEVSQKYDEVSQKYNEARQKCNEASQKYKPQLEEIHKKICGCKEWDGTELVFPK